MIAQDKRFGIVSSNRSVTKQETVHVIYVVTTPAKMWTALTDGELSKKIFLRAPRGERLKSGPGLQMWQRNGTLDGRRPQSLEAAGLPTTKH
jgi:hypothetical protein